MKLVIDIFLPDSSSKRLITALAVSLNLLSSFLFRETKIRHDFLILRGTATSFGRYFLNVFYICAYVFSFWSFFVIRIIFGAVCNSSLNCVFNFLAAKAMKIGLVSFGKSILWNSKVRKMEIRNSFVTKISNLENRIRRLGQLRCFKFHLFL